MIDVRELRIGNWVKSLDIEYSVISIDQKGNVKGMDVLATEDGNTTFNLDKTIQPIPLTEEILLKCGFKKINAKYFRKGALTIEVNLHNHFTISLLGKSIVNYKHLNQLQNLYFALTGEELEINL